MQRGGFSAYLLEHWPCRLLLSVDPWQHDPGYRDVANVAQPEQEEAYHAACAVLAPFGTRSRIARAESLQVANQCPDGQFDFVYLDARHDAASVAADLAAWWPLVKAGGILAGHDYVPDADWIQVQSTVDAWAAREGLTVGVTTDDTVWQSWWVQKRS